MAKKHVRMPAYPATLRVTQAGVSAGDFVIKGSIKGFAVEDTRTSAGDANDGIANLAGTVLLSFGWIGDVHIAAGGAGGGIVEGDPLKWDGTLDGGAGGFTDTGATATDFDAIAGPIADLAQGATVTGDVYVPSPF